jgi:hypothetical protein
VLHWARGHIPEALLIPAGVGAVSGTALSDIDEWWCPGHEIGIGVSQLSFAYIGAYIFNWLIVERPRAKALRGYYAAAWSKLVSIAAYPRDLVRTLSAMADPTKRPKESANHEELIELLPLIDWKKAIREGLIPRRY